MSPRRRKTDNHEPQQGAWRSWGFEMVLKLLGLGLATGLALGRLDVIGQRIDAISWRMERVERVLERGAAK